MAAALCTGGSRFGLDPLPSSSLPRAQLYLEEHHPENQDIHNLSRMSNQPIENARLPLDAKLSSNGCRTLSAEHSPTCRSQHRKDARSSAGKKKGLDLGFLEAKQRKRLSIWSKLLSIVVAQTTWGFKATPQPAVHQRQQPHLHMWSGLGSLPCWVEVPVADAFRACAGGSKGLCAPAVPPFFLRLPTGSVSQCLASAMRQLWQPQRASFCLEEEEVTNSDGEAGTQDCFREQCICSSWGAVCKCIRAIHLEGIY